MMAWKRFDFDSTQIDDGVLIIKGDPAVLKKVFDSANKVYCEVDSWTRDNGKLGLLEMRLFIEQREPDHKTQHELGNT
jgi:hypothetical protein